VRVRFFIKKEAGELKDDPFEDAGGGALITGDLTG